MRPNLKLIAITATISTLVGCATPGQQGPKARSVSYEEAMAYENSLRAAASTAPGKPEKIYVQPLNKKEPCKLPSTNDQISRSNFRAFWDGQCKNGYAFGLGRDVAISDTLHLEEITIYGDGGNNDGAPSVAYNFVLNEIRHIVRDINADVEYSLAEQILDKPNDFKLTHGVYKTSRTYGELVVVTSPFSTTQFLHHNDGKVYYKFSDNSAGPVINPANPTGYVEILNPKTGVGGGVSIIRHGTGQVRHVLVSGAAKEDVAAPLEYAQYIQTKIKMAFDAKTEALSKIEPAYQLEREYKYLACNGKHTIDGLDKDISTKICTWREQYKTKYDDALAKSKQALEDMRRKADEAAQQRQTQQQNQAMQQQRQQQQTQQAVQEVANAVNEFGLGMQNSSRQMQQNMMNTPMVAPNFQPFAPLGHTVPHNSTRIV
jgi:hypothetical protein